MRVSKLQKQILLILAGGFVKGVKSIDSVLLREVIEIKERAKLDRANFRKSCLTLVENDLINRTDNDGEIKINITVKGYEKALELRGGG